MPETPAPQRPRRRWGFWVGLGCVLAGLGLLAYVGWQFYGTNWTSHRKQQQAVQSLEATWRNGERLQPREVPSGHASALIRIPRFGKKYVVPVFEGITTDILASGYGHFPETADPGRVGNYALAAHRVTHGEPLRRMPELRPGDKIIVETARATYTYVLDTDPNKLVVPFTGVWVLDAHPRNPDHNGVGPPGGKGQRLITLTTCSELFHTDNRMIAFGHLLTSTPKSSS